MRMSCVAGQSYNLYAAGCQVGPGKLLRAPGSMLAVACQGKKLALYVWQQNQIAKIGDWPGCNDWS